MGKPREMETVEGFEGIELSPKLKEEVEELIINLRNPLRIWQVPDNQERLKEIKELTKKRK